MARELEPWGGEMHVPHWLRRLLRSPDPEADSAERVHERRQPGDSSTTVGQAADRAAAGPLTELYHEGRAQRRGRKPGG